MVETVSSAARLRAANLRVTAPRLAVLEALPPGRHLTVDTVATAARARLGTLSTQAVYDILAAFTTTGLVRRIQPAGGPARFESRAGDNHHHLVCRSCGATADVDCAVGAAPCLEPSAAAGFVVDQAEVTFWGACPACQSAGAVPTGTPPTQPPDTSTPSTQQRGSA